MGVASQWKWWFSALDKALVEPYLVVRCEVQKPSDGPQNVMGLWR